MPDPRVAALHIDDLSKLSRFARALTRQQEVQYDRGHHALFYPFAELNHPLRKGRILFVTDQNSRLSRKSAVARQAKSTRAEARPRSSGFRHAKPYCQEVTQEYCGLRLRSAFHLAFGKRGVSKALILLSSDSTVI
jgi:hypothetical protein